MKIFKLNDFIKGWFVGNFEPSIIKSKDFEIGIKKYKKGDVENKHYHKIATELTIIAVGKVKMFDSIYSTGDIIVVEPFDSTSFEALQDTITIVIKTPSITGDKYLE